MPLPLSETAARWRAALAAGPPAAGMWVASGSPVVAEICAGSGVDWLLIDSEHAPNDLRSILAQLQAVAPYPVTPVVRPPVGDPVLIKQLLDLGVEVLLIPMLEPGRRVPQGRHGDRVAARPDRVTGRPRRTARDRGDRRHRRDLPRPG